MRMGENKALITIDDKTLLQHRIESFQAWCDEVLVATPKSTVEALGYDVANRIQRLDDLLPDFQGPLSAMASAGAQAQSDCVMISSCDVWGVDESFYQQLSTVLNQLDAGGVFASFSDREQPLLAIIKSSKLKELEVFLLESAGSGERAEIKTGIKDKLKSSQQHSPKNKRLGVMRWYRDNNIQPVDMTHWLEKNQQAMTNLNTLADIDVLKAALKQALANAS